MEDKGENKLACFERQLENIRPITAQPGVCLAEKRSGAGDLSDH